MEVCLCLTHRQTNVTEKVCGLVNVTGMYPFLERQFTPTIEVAIGGVR